MNLNSMSQKNLLESYITPSPIVSRCYSSKASPFGAHIRGHSTYTVDKYLGNMSSFSKKNHTFGPNLKMPPLDHRTDFCDPLVKIVGGFVGSKSQASSHRGREFSLWDVIVDKVIEVMENPESKNPGRKTECKKNGKIHKIESFTMIGMGHCVTGRNCLGQEWYPTNVGPVYVQNNFSGVFHGPRDAAPTFQPRETEELHHETEDSFTDSNRRIDRPVDINPAGLEVLSWPQTSAQSGGDLVNPDSRQHASVRRLSPCVGNVSESSVQPEECSGSPKECRGPPMDCPSRPKDCPGPPMDCPNRPKDCPGPPVDCFSRPKDCPSPPMDCPSRPKDCPGQVFKHVLRPEAAEFTPRAASRTSFESESEEDSIPVDVLSSSCDSQTPSDTFLRPKVQRTLSECSVDSDDSFIVFESAEDDPVILSEESDDEDLCSDEDLDEIDNPVLIPHNLEFSQPPAVLSRLEEANKKWAEHYSDVQVQAAVPADRKVKFAQGSDLVKVKHLISWDFAHRAARIGPWEMYHRDSERFKSRINSLSAVLSPVLAKRHREKIYAERFQT